jgi:hypothetical protein
LNADAYSCRMTKSTSIRVRFDFTFAKNDVAYEKVYKELCEIENTYKYDPKNLTIEQRKHFLRIVHSYSNGGFSQQAPAISFAKPEQAAPIVLQPSAPTLPRTETPAQAASTEPIAEPTTQAQMPQAGNSDADDDFAGIRKLRGDDGKLKFGKFVLE